MERYIEIDGWKSHVTFSACHMLLRHDKCSRLHGHTYAINLRIKGLPGEDMLLLDFHLIKAAIRGIAQELDHMTLVPGENESIGIMRDQGSNITVDMQGKIYSIPAEDVLVLPVKATTVEELSRYLLELFIERVELPGVIDEVSLGVDEGQGQGAWACIRLR